MCLTEANLWMVALGPAMCGVICLHFERAFILSAIRALALPRAAVNEDEER